MRSERGTGAKGGGAGGVGSGGYVVAGTQDRGERRARHPGRSGAATPGTGAGARTAAGRRLRTEARHSLFLNPYDDWSFSRCPSCERATRVRRFPLVLLLRVSQSRVEFASIDKSCRHCPACDLVIVHRSELEPRVAEAMGKRRAAEKDYIVLGTQDREAWRENMAKTSPMGELRGLHLFKEERGFVPAEPGEAEATKAKKARRRRAAGRGRSEAGGGTVRGKGTGREGRDARAGSGVGAVAM